MPHDVVALEHAEIEAFGDIYRAASPDVIEAAGLSVTPVANGIVLATNRIDVLALNRVMGLGLTGPVTDDALDQVIDVLDRCGSPRFFVPVAPVEGHGDVERALAARGIRHYNNWIRLSRGVSDIPTTVETNLEVRAIDRTSALAFGEIVSSAFGYPPAVEPLAGLTVGRPGWRHYLAYEGDIPVAAAAMYLAGGTAAWFGFAATGAAYRKRGAQQALVVRRLQDAADAGCSWVSVETAEDSVAKDAPSFRNLKRLGFEIAYSRPNHLWTRPTSFNSPSG